MLANFDNQIKLNNGIILPRIGFGTAMIEPYEMDDVIKAAIDCGYRLFDSSPIYGNEKAFGEAIKKCGIPRNEILISSKLRNSQQQYNDAIASFYETLKQLDTDYLDLYLIYWPCPAYNRYCEAWKALEKLYKEGYVRAIGVSNFLPEHLEKLAKASDVVPVVNELECNPYLSIKDLRQYCVQRNICVEAWFPLGGPKTKLGGEIVSGKRLLDDEVILSLANKYKKSPAQIVLRWEVQSNIIPLPKSSKPERISENIDIFDFKIADNDMKLIDGLNINRRCGHDPATTNDQF